MRTAKMPGKKDVMLDTIVEVLRPTSQFLMWMVASIGFAILFAVNFYFDVSHLYIAPKWRSGVYGSRFYEDYCSLHFPVHDLSLNTFQKIELCSTSSYSPRFTRYLPYFRNRIR